MQGCGSAEASASVQSRSRPSSISASACGRCRITQRSGLCAAIAIASSSRGLYSTIRFGSIPHEAESTTLGVASSMRTASSLAANPPNTTECTAPSRAHASIAITASGTMGM